MTLADSARVLARALSDFAEALDQNSRAAAAQAARLAAARPVPPVDDATVVQVGRHRGEKLTDIADDDLEWYLRTVARNVDDPAKERFRSVNEKLLAAARGEQERRAGVAQGSAT